MASTPGRRSADTGWALVGGDGSLHAAANVPLATLAELAIIPAGRANNIARSLGIPSSRPGALRTAPTAPARTLDALVVRTRDRSLYALEAVTRNNWLRQEPRDRAGVLLMPT